MAASSVTVANLALTRIGQRPIVTMHDTNNAAILVNLHYDETRRSVLRALPWKFASRRAELAALVDPPVYGWGQAYQLPARSLYVIETSMDDTGEPWDVEGRAIVTNAISPIKIKYVEDVTDTTQFDPMFTDALVEKLAAEVVYGITKQAAARERLLQSYQMKLDEAAAVDGQQGTQQAIESNDMIITRG